jgi:hypothetical protein
MVKPLSIIQGETPEYSFWCFFMVISLSIYIAVLKNSVDLYTLLIGAEGTKTPVGVWFRGDPAGASAEEARRNTHEPLVPGAEINRQI